MGAIPGKPVLSKQKLLMRAVLIRTAYNHGAPVSMLAAHWGICAATVYGIIERERRAGRIKTPRDIREARRRLQLPIANQ